ncbi:MAG: hypothetical protein ACI4XW_04715 [Candidatus Spyradocola sp.]
MQSFTVTALSAKKTTELHLTGNPVLINQNTGRPIRRSSSGGRLYIYQENTLSVTLEPGAQYQEFEIEVRPKAGLAFDKWRYTDVEKIYFWGKSVLVSAQSREEIPDDDEDDPGEGPQVSLAHMLGLDAKDVKPANAPNEDPANAQKAALETQIAAAQQANAELETQLRTLNGQTDALRKKIARAQQTHDELEARHKELDTHRKELERVKGSAKSAQDAIGTLKQQLDEENAALEQALTEERALQAQVEDLRAQNKESDDRAISLQAEIKEWNRQITEGAKRLETLQAQLRQKEAEYAPYSVAVLEEIQQQIAQLTERNRDAERQYLELMAQKRVQDTLLDNQRQQIEGVQQHIDAQPEQLRALQAEYERLTQRLEQIEHAETDCSEEKQQQLREQITQREPIAQQLTQQHRVLQEQSAALQSTVARLRDENNAAVEALWPELLGLMESLRGNVDEKNAQLDELCEEAQRFTEQVELCANKQAGLTQWYRTDRTPLQTLLDRIGLAQDNENHQLLQTLSLDNAGRIGELFTTVETSLGELDAILRDAVTATQRDEKYLRLRAQTNENQARAEMRKA